MVLAGLLLLLNGCANEVEVHSPEGSLPVVYCLLDLDHDDQYVRVGRTFRGGQGMNPDGLPDDSLRIREEHRVYVERWDQGLLAETIEFEPVAGFQRDSGLFAPGPLDIYRARFSVRSNTRYLLYVWFPADDRMVSGETRTVGRPVIEDPKPLSSREITFIPERSYTLRWFTGSDSGINQGCFTIRYLEYLQGGTQLQSFQLYLQPYYVTQTGSWVSQVVSPNRFFNALIENIHVEDSVSRELLPMDFTMITAGDDLSFFIKAQQPSFWMNLSQYTNLDGAFGIFSSVSEISVPNLRLSDLTRYFVATDSLTRKLNFRNPYEYP